MHQVNQANWCNMTFISLFFSHGCDPTQAHTGIQTWATNVRGGQQTNQAIHSPVTNACLYLRS